jgi:hypothetical protein
MWSSKAARSKRTRRHRTAHEVAAASLPARGATEAPCVGRVVGVTPEGRTLVDFPGNLQGPVAARSISTIPALSNDRGQCAGAVLLVFENGDRTLPIIVGVLGDGEPLTQERDPGVQRPQQAVVDGEKVVIDASQEIVLRCGKGSITLTKDGKVVIKGTYVVSRSAGLNKIQGGAVKIN